MAKIDFLRLGINGFLMGMGNAILGIALLFIFMFALTPLGLGNFSTMNYNQILTAGIIAIILYVIMLIITWVGMGYIGELVIKRK